MAAMFLSARSLPAQAAEPPQYNRDVRPILADHCFACHGPDSMARKADLRLDRREEATKAEAIVPGNPDKSAMIERIFTDSRRMMPPATAHRKLTAGQKDLLRRWVAAGAEYQPHWSLLAPKRPPLPEIKTVSWVRNPVDRFILARLEENGLHPAPEADRPTLARRLSLDLIGLPPTPEMVESYVNDRGPDAYERLVDQLLKSPQWGEHRGRYWLDAARYADTHGLHTDNFREMWPYRDWVIGAFNRNLPFDQFAIEQLAGDLLPNRTLDQLVASGFNRCHITTSETGIIADEYLVLYTRDRTETTAQVWLGLTANCAVCHDHKFDPLSQKEFYQMAAFFNHTTQGANDGSIKATSPVIVVPRLEDTQRWAVLAVELANARQQVAVREKQTPIVWLIVGGLGLLVSFDWSRSRRLPRRRWVGFGLGLMLLLAVVCNPTWIDRTGIMVSADACATLDQARALIPTDSLMFHAPLNEGPGKKLEMTVAGGLRRPDLTPEPAWNTGHVAAKALEACAATPVELDDVGDFDLEQDFSYGAWVRFPRRGTTGAVLSRMDDTNDFRGWDLCIEDDHICAHIVHQLPGDALKVIGETQLQPNQWYHLFVTYDGSGKADGLRLYVNGKPEPAQVQADTLKGTTRTTVPFKLARRHTTSHIESLLLQDVRVYVRALSGLDVDRLVKATRVAWLMSKPAGLRTAPEKDELFDWWLEGYARVATKVAHLQQEVQRSRSAAPLPM